MLIYKNHAVCICVAQTLKAGCIFFPFCLCSKVRIISIIFRGLLQFVNTWNPNSCKSLTLKLPPWGEGEPQPVFHSPCSTKTARTVQEKRMVLSCSHCKVWRRKKVAGKCLVEGTEAWYWYYTYCLHTDFSVSSSGTATAALEAWHLFPQGKLGTVPYLGSDGTQVPLDFSPAGTTTCILSRLSLPPDLMESFNASEVWEIRLIFCYFALRNQLQ